MRRTILALTAGLALAAGATTAANALDFEVGPGGVYVGPHRYVRDYDRGYAYGGGCRVVIDRHINRFGEEVTVRRRICD
jgi:hypothetical protein